MGTDHSTGYYLGLYAADTLKYKTTTDLFEDMISGYDKVQDGFYRPSKKKAVVLFNNRLLNPVQYDFSPFLAALKPADCVTAWFTPGLAARFVAQYYAAGKTMPLLVPDSSVLSRNL